LNGSAHLFAQTFNIDLYIVIRLQLPLSQWHEDMPHSASLFIHVHMTIQSSYVMGPRCTLYPKVWYLVSG